MQRIVVGVSGASGMPLAQALLMHLATLPNLRVHLVISEGAERVLRSESQEERESLVRYAHEVHEAADLGAGPASGSWLHAGMIVCPCSMNSLAAIATGAGRNLLHRAADVTLKERRPLVLVVRETPLNRIHLKNMLAASEAGAILMPFMPAFYNKASSLDEMMRHFSGRLLDQLTIPHGLCARWGE